jgi:NADPH2:quinone reductase
MVEIMKAVRIHAYGGPEVLVLEDAPRPEPGPGEVLIRVRAAGINPLDSRTRAGGGVARYWKDKEFPLILGWDVSGTVAACGAGVSRFAVGDDLFGLIRVADAGGCYAEYVTAPADQLVAKPRAIDHVHTAALPRSALTAWQMLFGAAGLVPGQKLLVHAASGGVGHFAVQFGKWRGADVTGTASGANEGFVRELGAAHFVDYRQTSFDQVLSDIDVQLDTVGPAVQDRCWNVMKKGGVVVSIVPDRGPLSPEKAAAHGVRAVNVIVKPDVEALGRIAGLVDEGAVRPFVEKTFKLSEAVEAHEHVSTGHTRGKIVFALD